MSRVIKFRAWNGKYMLDAVYGDWVSFDGVPYTEAEQRNSRNTEIKRVNNYTLMQYIGRKDINGIDVYEGDIVRGWVSRFPDSKTTGTIEYNEHAQAYQLRYENIFNSHANEFTHRYHFFEVLGNIYQNPNLLNHETI